MATDKLGQDIQVGSYIIYGHALGRCAGLRLGKVLAIKNVTENCFNYDTSAWEPKEVANFTVIGVDDDWNHKEPQLLSRKSTLKFSERVVMMPPHAVPESHKKLLDNYQG